MVIFNPRNSPVSVRAEGTYSGIEASSYSGVTRAKISFGTANVVVGSRGPSGRPYFIAGGGAYDLDFTASSRTAPFSGKQTRFGWNAGGGIAFPLGGGSSIFIEARYHSVQTKDRFTFVPVSVGVVF
jgi:opacity protein-like surface antigen